MSYDPQRSRRRPQPPDAGPAPVDAILEAPDGSDDAGDTARPDPSGAPATPPAEKVLQGAVDRGDLDVTAPSPLPEIASERASGSSRAVALAVVAGLLVLVLLWLRRRRRAS